MLYFVNLHRPTYQESTPTSNIALLILCSRQAIVPLCRPGGVRAARFNPPPPSVGVQGVSDYVCIKTKFFPKSCAKFLDPPFNSPPAPPRIPPDLRKTLPFAVSNFGIIFGMPFSRFRLPFWLNFGAYFLICASLFRALNFH